NCANACDVGLDGHAAPATAGTAPISSALADSAATTLRTRCGLIMYGIAGPPCPIAQSATELLRSAAGRSLGDPWLCVPASRRVCLERRWLCPELRPDP